MEENIKGKLFRSKAQWYIKGEHNNKYFFNLEKNNYRKKSIKSLINDRGKEIRDQKEILSEQAKFYKKLYKSNSDIKFNYKNESEIKLTPTENPSRSSQKSISQKSCELAEILRARKSISQKFC